MIKFSLVFLFILSLLIIIKEIFRLFKSVKKRTDFEISPINLTILGVSISYVLTYIITI